MHNRYSQIVIRLSVWLVLLLSAHSSFADSGDNFMQLYERFRAVAGFDHQYPREKVFLHLDNNAYIEEETMWFKAYVVRASTLQPTTLSRVLYVELLNADGQLIERQLLRVDSLGQAHGQFELKLPIKAGYYEVRAFTREMLNWGDEGCFSRVIPVFAKDKDELSIDLPEMKHTRRVASDRRSEKQSKRRLTFYPEGGNRVRGVAQNFAFKETNDKGLPTEDTMYIYRGKGELYSKAVPLHEGMGRFLLPADFPEDGYVELMGKRYELPIYSDESYAMSVNQDTDGYVVSLTSIAPQGKLMGLMAICRERVCYFDTLTLHPGITEYYIPKEKLYGGVNRIELFDIDGRSHACRMVWKEAEGRALQLKMRQNEKCYAPFTPIAMELELCNALGQPVSTTFSLSVRDNGGDLVDAATSLDIDLLLSSELKGYVHRPDFYFENSDALRCEALDLLLMVQGWRANSFETMSGHDTFKLTQPIEEHITFDGTVFHDNDKREPFANLDLKVQMYAFSGGALSGETRTDTAGYFVLQSNVDFEGDYIAQFVTRNEADKKKWSRIALNRWFAPQNRYFDGREMMLTQPQQKNEEQIYEDVEVFVWKDTIPRIINSVISEATVTGRNKYRGFTGNRYTFNGGEEGGMRQCEYFYNIGLETERAKDMGLQPGYIYDFMAMLDGRNEYDATGAMADTPQNYVRHEALSINESEAHSMVDENMRNSNAAGTFDNEFSGDDDFSSEVYFRGALTKVFLNNSDLHFKMYDQPMMAEEVKTVVVLRNGAHSRHLVGEVDAKYKYVMILYEWPDYFRYKPKKGVEKRRIQGFSTPKTFYNPSYRGLDLPTDEDCRRTLYWNPQVKTDADGRASVVLFNNSRENVELRISAKGVSSEGLLLSVEK